MGQNVQLSRRQAMKRLGISAFGAAGALGAAGGHAQAGTGQRAKPYKVMDVEKLRKLGHKGAYMGNCSSGSFYALIKAYSELTGKTFENLTLEPPENLMHFGGGGIVGRRMCCGALLGSAAAVNLITDSDTARDIISRLFAWYEQAAFPSNISNRYAEQGLFEDKACVEPLDQTVAGSAMCSDSLRSWFEKSGHKFRSPQRLERCNRLTADVVAKTAELLNAAMA